MKNNLFIIGDIHGDFDALQKLLTQKNEDEELIFIGDMIDRGDKSLEVVNYAMENNVKCILGNHEQMFLASQYCKNKHLIQTSSDETENLSYSYLNISQNGGDKFLQQLEKLNNNSVQDIIQYLMHLPLDIEINNVIITHTPLTKKQNELKDSVDCMEKLWSINPNKHTKGKINVFGHIGSLVKTYTTTKFKMNNITFFENKIPLYKDVLGEKESLSGIGIDAMGMGKLCGLKIDSKTLKYVIICVDKENKNENKNK